MLFLYLCFSFTVTHPDFSLGDQLISDAFVIAIIGFVINISQAKLLAKKNGYAVHPDQVSGLQREIFEGQYFHGFRGLHFETLCS